MEDVGFIDLNQNTFLFAYDALAVMIKCPHFCFLLFSNYKCYPVVKIYVYIGVGNESRL